MPERQPRCKSLRHKDLSGVTKLSLIDTSILQRWRLRALDACRNRKWPWMRHLRLLSFREVEEFRRRNRAFRPGIKGFRLKESSEGGLKPTLRSRRYVGQRERFSFALAASASIRAKHALSARSDQTRAAAKTTLNQNSSI